MAGDRLTRKIGLVALGRSAGTFSVFAVNAILARTWPQDELGIFLAIWTVGNTLVPLFLLGLPTSLLYFFPRQKAEARKGLMLQITLCLTVSGVLLIGLLSGPGPWLIGRVAPRALEGMAEPAGYLLPFLPYLFSLVAGGFVESALVAAGRPGWQAGLSAFGAFGLIGVAWTGAVGGAGVRQLLLLFSVVGTVRLAAGLAAIGRSVGFIWGGGQWSGLRELFGYALPVWLNDAAGSLSRYVDRFVVLFWFSAATFSHYHLGAIEIPISLLLTSVGTVLIPEVSRYYEAGKLAAIGLLWRQAVGRLALVVLPAFCLLFVFAGPVVELYLTARYGESRWVFQLFLLALPLRCAVYNPLLVGIGKARWALWGSLVDLSLNISLSLALTAWLLAAQSRWAFLGPAAATVIATYVQVGLLVWLLARHFGWEFRRLLPWGRLARVGLFSWGAAAIGWWAAAWSAAALPAGLALGSGVFGVTFVLMLWASPPEREEVRVIFRGIGGGRRQAG